MRWNDIHTGHVFKDGSEAISRFEMRTMDTYTLFYKDSALKGTERAFTASADHLLLCDTGKCSKEAKKSIAWLVEYSYIPKTYDLHISLNQGEWEEVIEAETRELTRGVHTYIWLTLKEIHKLMQAGETVKLITDLKKNKKTVPSGCAYSGKRNCFCIATTTGHYEVCGLVSHNSVSLRNMVFHALTHSDDIKLALIDLKRSEFEYLKGTNGIVGVGNTPREAAEILRLAREIMYKRNEENAKRRLSNFADWQPQQPTDKIKIFNTEFPEDTTFDVEVAGEKKKMTAKEILHFMKG